MKEPVDPRKMDEIPPSYQGQARAGRAGLCGENQLPDPVRHIQELTGHHAKEVYIKMRADNSHYPMAADDYGCEI